MTCTVLLMPGGGKAIICNRGKRKQVCSICKRNPVEFLCDWPVGKGKKSKKTCDKALCKTCARETGVNTHYCFVHPIDVGQTELPLLPPGLLPEDLRR